MGRAFMGGMQELFKMVYVEGKVDSVRHLTAKQLAVYQKQSRGGIAHRVEHDGFLTTIREYAPAIAATSKFSEPSLDEPCIAHAMAEDATVICSGRAIVGFYYAHLDSDGRVIRFHRTPAYIVINEHDNYGPLGMTLVQSA